MHIGGKDGVIVREERLGLPELRPGERGIVCELCAEDGMRRRLLDLGFVPGTAVDCVGRSPAGDPAAYCVRGAVIALRNTDGRSVRVRRG